MDSFVEIYKAHTRNPENPSEVIDLSPSMNIVPNRWGFVNQLGLFEHVYGSMRAFGFNINQVYETVAEAKPWGERTNFTGGQDGKWVQFEIPHYPLNATILPTDIQGKVDFSGGAIAQDILRTIDGVKADKVIGLRRGLSNALNKARMQVIKDGTVTAHNLQYNMYDIFGVTRQEIDLGLENNLADPKVAIGEVFGTVQDSANMDDNIETMVALCSTSFFNALTTNQYVRESYLHYNQPQGAGVLNQRMESGLGLDSRYRTFLYEGIYFVEVRGTFAGDPFIEDGKAYLVPLGTTGVFQTHFAPADRFSHLNRTAQEVYLFEKLSEDDDQISLAAQSNFINICKRPQLMVTLSKD